MFLLACHPKPQKPQIEIVIPKECVTSDIHCKPNGKDLRCKFDKFTACEHVEVVKK